ncbi:MAG: CopG family transcriptional regulator [Acidobacteria bacterium]|nr:MAG: CopG family transcriptional regulator [Acidobacteriota bacterium]
MTTAKIAVSMDQETVKQLDRLVARGVFPSRSRAIQLAVQERLARISRDRLARECSKLDPKFEAQMSEEGLEAEVEQWPEY